MSSPYGPRVLKGVRGYHGGVDLVGTSKKIGAVSEGTVVGVHRGETRNAKQGGRSYGNFVKYRTPDNYLVMNAHLRHQSIPGDIKVGSKIGTGDLLGLEGDTGHSYGSHLHFQIEHPSAPTGVKGKTLNPAKFLSGIPLMDSNRFQPGGYSEDTPEAAAISAAGTAPGDTGANLSNLLSVIKETGNKFLYFITGGLIGSNANSASISTGSTRNTKIDSEVLLLTNEEVAALNLSPGEAEIIDLGQDVSYKVYWDANTRTHSDYSTLTPEDTDKKRMACGGVWEWTPRPVLLKIKGKILACGTNSYPHGTIIGTAKPGLDNSPNPPVDGKWPLGGHFCLWYKDSVSNNSGVVPEGYAEEMRAAAAKAYEIGNSLYQSASVGQPGFISDDTSNEARIYNFFSSKGLSPQSIAAIMGTIQQESNFDPSKHQKIKGGGVGKGRGLFQWETGGRFEELKKFATSRGKDWIDLDTQLEFAWQELNSDHYDKWFSKGVEKNWRRKGISPYPDGIKGFFADTDVAHAAKAFDAAYTRSADAYAGYTENGASYRQAGFLEKRVEFAQKSFKKWQEYAEQAKKDKEAKEFSQLQGDNVSTIDLQAPAKTDVKQPAPRPASNESLLQAGGPEEEASIAYETFRDPAADDDEGGIGGPFDSLDNLLGIAHSTANMIGLGDKVKVLPRSTNDLFNTISKKANIRIPKSPVEIMDIAKDQMSRLPIGKMQSMLDSDFAEAAQSGIQMPGFGDAFKKSDILSEVTSKMRLPSMFKEIPESITNIMAEGGDYSVPSPRAMEVDELAKSITTSMDTSTMESLLTAVLTELRAINGNTANTGTMLDTIHTSANANTAKMKNTFQTLARSSNRSIGLPPKPKDVTSVGAIIRGN